MLVVAGAVVLAYVGWQLFGATWVSSALCDRVVPKRTEVTHVCRSEQQSGRTLSGKLPRDRDARSWILSSPVRWLLGMPGEKASTVLG